MTSHTFVASPVANPFRKQKFDKRTTVLIYFAIFCQKLKQHLQNIYGFHNISNV